MADIETGAAKDTLTLIDLIWNTNIDAAFGAEQSASSAGDTSVGDKEKLICILSIHKIPPYFAY